MFPNIQLKILSINHKIILILLKTNLLYWTRQNPHKYKYFFEKINTILKILPVCFTFEVKSTWFIQVHLRDIEVSFPGYHNKTNKGVTLIFWFLNSYNCNVYMTIVYYVCNSHLDANVHTLMKGTLLLKKDSHRLSL